MNTTIEQFEKDITQLLIMAMLSKKIVSEPIMHFLKTGNHLRDNYFYLLLNDPGFIEISRSDPQTHLIALAYHAFGAGAYVCIRNAQGEDFSGKNLEIILAKLTSIGSIKLALDSMHIDPDSNNKKVLDDVIASSVEAVVEKYREELQSQRDEDYLRVLLNLFFNAGVTTAMQRVG